MPLPFIVSGIFLILIISNVITFLNVKYHVFSILFFVCVMLGYVSNNYVYANYSINLFHLFAFIAVFYLLFKNFSLNLIIYSIFFSIMCFVAFYLHGDNFLLTYNNTFYFILFLFVLICCEFNILKGWLMFECCFIFLYLINLYFEKKHVEFYTISFHVLFEVLLFYSLISIIVNLIIQNYRRKYASKIYAFTDNYIIGSLGI